MTKMTLTFDAVSEAAPSPKWKATLEPILARL